MTAAGRLTRAALVTLVLLAAACTTAGERAPRAAAPAGDLTGAQAPAWSSDDRQFFLHGTMSAEVVPERVLRAFIATYPDLFPRADLAHFGLIPDPAFGWPIGMSRREVEHLGGLSSVGVNCAACHVAELVAVDGGAPVRVLGATSHFDAEAFFGALTVATFRTAEPAAMLRFLRAYLAAGEGGDDPVAQATLTAAWMRQEREVVAAIAGDPTGAAGVAPGGLHAIAPGDVRLDRAELERGAPLAPLARALLRLFHNMRAALHIPEQVPGAVPPASGPGRNDAFGLLSATLLGVPRPYAPVKYGIVWNLEARRWVHWDGNTRSPIGRNILASLGLGAPLVGTMGRLEYAMVRRQTDLSEKIRAPRYPFAVDQAAATRGSAIYRARCAGCHDGPESDARLHAPGEIGTDPARAEAFTQVQADGFNRFLAGVRIAGYRPGAEPGLRATGRYVAPGLAGVWARSPYLHNGSVRTLRELLTPPAARAVTFQRGSHRYDTAALGYADEGAYRLDTRTPGNSSTGHAYGADLGAADRRDLIEFLKTK
jgi:processive rubber oxygenase RoxA-like protein